MRGLGSVYQRGQVWWIRYQHGRQEYRESARSTQRDDAVRLLCHRLGALNTGRPGGPSEEERLTFEDLAADYIQERTVRGITGACLQWSKSRVENLKTIFAGVRAVEITTHRMREYARKRLALGAAPGTVNRDFGALSRMFTLAMQAGRMTRRPYIPRLRENPPRQGFMEHGEYLAIREHLSPAYRDVLDFGYFSGWRKGEVLTLEWRDVDREGRVIRLRPEVSKTREGRVLVLSAPLHAVMERRWQARMLGCPLVFHEASLSLQGFKNSWERACRAAGCPGKLFHDLRRTAVRNMVRAGIPERVAMQVSGHKTRSVFDRYNIVSEGDLRQAAERLAAYVESARG
jgi:integrase